MFSIFLVAIAVAANRAEENADQPTPGRRRTPASVESPAAAVDLPAPTPLHTEKLHGPVNVVIELVGAAPSAAGDTFVVRGRISSDQAIDHVTYRWALPADVELVSGAAKGEVAHLDQRQSFQPELTLKARGPNNAKIHLLAVARAHGARFAESAQFNTTRQAAFAKSRARLLKSTLKNAADPNQDLRVMH